MYQSAQVMHMLTKQQVFYDDTHKQALGYQNPFYLKKAQRIKPTLYDGSVIAKEHVVISVIDDEETLILEEESRSKILDKQNDPILIEKKINISPIDYLKLNNIKEDFGKRFVTQKELYVEQAFWLKHSFISETPVKLCTPVRIEAPSELPKCSVDKNNLEIKIKQLSIDNDQLLNHIMSQETMHIAVNSIDILDIVENLDLNAQLQEKVFAIASLKNELRKLKGKNVFNFAVSKPIATIAPGMFKHDIEPISYRLKNNRDAYEVYLDKNIEYTDTIRGIVECARKQNLLRVPMQKVWDQCYNCKELGKNRRKGSVECRTRCIGRRKLMYGGLMIRIGTHICTWHQLQEVTPDPVDILDRPLIEPTRKVTAQILPQNKIPNVNNTNVIAPGISQQSTRNRGKAIVTSSAPTYDPEPATVTEDEEMSKEKEIDKLMALISLSFKKIYKPTNNNLRTSSNTSRANQDNSPRTNRGTGYDNQRAINVAGARENVGTPVVQKSGIQCYNCKEYGHVSRECQKPKRVKDAAYHKEKMLLCKQEEAGVQLNAEQADWKDDTDDESDDQELEAHYMYMAQLQEVTPDPVDNSGPIFDDEPTHKLVEIILFIVDSGCSKHMTGNLKLLTNFVEKFLGTVKFGNDQIAPILGYGDLVQGAITIKRVYYVEGLNHNLFSVGQFCDADLEVAFRKSTCYIRDLKGNDLLKGCYNEIFVNVSPYSDETFRLEKERRSKLSDLIRPFDYDQLNKLYDLFVPQREKSPEQYYFPKTSKMSHTSSNQEFSKESFRKQTTLLEKRMDESIPWDHKCKSSKELFKIKKSVDTIFDGVERCKQTIAKRTYFGNIDPFIQNTIEGNFGPQISKLNADLEQFHLCLKEEMVADLRYFNSLENEKPENNVNNLEKELSKSRTTSKNFEALQKHAINLELDLQQCKEKIKNDKSFKENQSNVFLKEREQYFEIQDLKAQLQDKGIAISELKKLIEKMKGKSVETKFEKSSVIRQPNAFKSQRQSILGKPAIFSDSLAKKDFSKSKPVTSKKVSNDFSKPVTAQILPQDMLPIVKTINVIAPGMYNVHTKPNQTRTPQLHQDIRKPNKRVSFSTGVIPQYQVLADHDH
ncbi:retrovirus-related pol polyprotein from transposon TNT 1-94 [Tanacetum coccineum]